MTLLGLKIVEWATVSDFTERMNIDPLVPGARPIRRIPETALNLLLRLLVRSKWAGQGVPFPSFLFCICPARGHPADQPVS